jgi:hypothetical protein
MDEYQLGKDIQSILQRLDRLEGKCADTLPEPTRTPSESRQPQSLHPPRYSGPNPPRPPVRLTRDSIEEFLGWVAAVPVSDRELIQRQVAEVAADDAIVEALLKHLFHLPVQDFGRHLMLLSVLGEMRHPHCVEPLKRFVNLPGHAVIPPPPPEQSSGLPGTSHLDYGAALQARAVEMLAYSRHPDALEAVLKAASDHGSRAVRLAAIDAYAFNHDDHLEAVERVRRIARPEEAKFVGLPRRSRDADPAAFDARVRAFYERYPEERPPAPSHDAKATTARLPSEKPHQRRHSY